MTLNFLLLNSGKTAVVVSLSTSGRPCLAIVTLDGITYLLPILL